MTAFAIMALFSAITVIVGLTLFDSALKFYNAVGYIRIGVQDDRAANPAPEAAGAATHGVVTAQRVRTAQVFTAQRRGAQPSAGLLTEAPGVLHAAA